MIMKMDEINFVASDRRKKTWRKNSKTNVKHKEGKSSEMFETFWSFIEERLTKKFRNLFSGPTKTFR